MNKKLIAMAVAAGMAAPLAATAAPTVYGQLQAELASIDVDAGWDTIDGTPNTFSYEGIPAGESGLVLADNKRGRLGIKGSEDLGNNLMALYKFEWQVDTTEANLTDGSRESFVGLKGNFGTFLAGTVKSPYKYTGGVKYDPFVASVLEARSNGGMSGKLTDGTDFGVTSAGGAFGHHGFLSQTLSYRNKLGAIDLWVTYSPDEAGTAKGRDGDIVASAKYKAKGWEAFVAYAANDTLTTGYSNNPSSDEYTATKFGGQWKSGPHQLSAQYEMTTLTLSGVDNDADVMYVDYQFKMGKNTLDLAYGNTDFDGGGSVDFLRAAVLHKFSKKTRGWLGYRNTDADQGVGEISAISAGMRVDF